MNNENDLTFYQQETGASVHNLFPFLFTKKKSIYISLRKRVQNKYEKIHIKIL